METKSTPNKPIDQRIRTIGAIGQGICTAGMIWWFYDMFIQSLFLNPFQGTYSFSKMMEAYGISGDVPGIFNMVFTVAVFMTMPVMLLFWLVRKAFGEFAKGSILSPVIARTILGVALISFSVATFKLLYWASENPLLGYSAGDRAQGRKRPYRLNYGHHHPLRCRACAAKNVPH